MTTLSFPEILSSDLKAFKEIQQELGFSDTQLLGILFFYLSSSGQVERVITALKALRVKEERDQGT